MSNVPIKRTCAATALLLAGATAGVVAAKFWAPNWLATPWSAKAFVSAITHTDAPATQPTAPAPAPAPVTANAPETQPHKPAPATHAPAPRPSTPRTTVTPPSQPQHQPPTAPVATPADDAVRRSIRSFLLTCRSQMDAYKSQHGGRLPDFSKYPAWHQFTQKTHADGTPAPDGAFGPYLKAAPVNPLNGFGGIGLVRSDPKPGQTLRAEKLGFVICTTTGNVFATDRDGRTILADVPAPAAHPPAVATTRPTPAAPPVAASPAAPDPTLPMARPLAGTPQQRAEALMSQLQMLRTEIEMYKLHHTDLAPDFPRFPMWEQMVRKTRGDGAPDGKGAFGPYLDRRPVNPLNGFIKVECAPRVAYDYQVAGQQVGYVFDTSNGRLFATNESGGLWRE